MNINKEYILIYINIYIHDVLHVDKGARSIHCYDNVNKRIYGIRTNHIKVLTGKIPRGQHSGKDGSLKKTK